MGGVSTGATARQGAGRWARIASLGLAVAAVEAFVLALWLRFNAAPPGGGSEFPADFVNYYYPMTEQVVARWARGELPLWNPQACAGLPLLATLQVGAFHPGMALSLWLSPEVALPARMLLESGLGALFALLLFRAWGAGLLAASFGAALFVFACVMGRSFWPPELATVIWLPWLLLCADRMARRGRLRHWLGLAVGTALALLSGFPQYLVYGFALVGPVAALRLVEAARADARPLRLAGRRGLALVAAVALGLGLAGVQLLPTAELVGEGVRAHALTAREVHYLGVQGTLGRFVANAVDPRPKGITFAYRGDTGYLGIAALLLAAVGLAARRRAPLSWLLVGIGSAALLLSYGFAGPAAALYALYAKIPVVGAFRTPERLQLLTLLAWIALAVAGFDALARGALRRQAMPALLTAGGLAVAAAAWGGTGAALRAAACFTLVFAAWRAAPRLRARVVLCAALWALAALDVWTATAAQGSLRALPVAWARIPSAHGHVAGTPHDLLAIVGTRPPERMAFVRVDPISGAGPLAGVPRLRCLEPLKPRALALLEERARRRDPRGLDAGPERFPGLYDSAGVARILEATSRGPLDADERRALTRALRARFHAGLPPDPEPAEHLQVRLAENPDALPRAYLVHEVEVVPLVVALDRLLDGRLDATRALVERDPGPLAHPDGPRRRRPAHIAVYRPERVEIDVHAEAAGLLVLSDTYYPGWTARLGDETLPIVRTNGLFRGVRVPAGEHRVIFEYAPASLRRGAALSLASALAIALAPVVVRYTRMRT